MLVEVSRETPRRCRHLLLGLLLILMSVPFPVLAEQRIALVIGKSWRRRSDKNERKTEFDSPNELTQRLVRDHSEPTVCY